MVYNVGHDLVVRIISMGNPHDLLWVTVSCLHLLRLYEFKYTGLMFMLMCFFGVLNYWGGLNLQGCLFPSTGLGRQGALSQLFWIKWAMIFLQMTILVAAESIQATCFQLPTHMGLLAEFPSLCGHPPLFAAVRAQNRFQFPSNTFPFSLHLQIFRFPLILSHFGIFLSWSQVKAVNLQLLANSCFHF